MYTRLATFLALLACCSSAAAAAPLAERYLIEGKLAEGEKALQAQLQKTPDDDQARFGLGVVQFLTTYQHLGENLYRYGLRTERAVRNQPIPLNELLPQNPKPEKLTYAAVRQIIETWVADLTQAEATLAAVKDEAVKLPLHVGQISIDLFGQGRPVNATVLLGQVAGPGAAVEEFVIGFDRGDVCWLRGYCHFLAAWGEILLAIDGQEMFDCCAHLFFDKVDSPHDYLQQEPRHLDSVTNFNRPVISDLVAFLSLLRFPLQEPQRMQAALKHLEGVVAMSKQMWTHYLAETDDDYEWIPNPKQTGVLQIAVTQEMLDTWLATVNEVDQLLQGKCLLPFWRGTATDRGVNLRRVFTEPQPINVFLWIQGTAATPYLEKGPLTRLVDPRMLNRLNRTFGGMRFIGFAFWFN